MRYFLQAFKNIFNYQGRARRAEYGWFMLTNMLLSFGVAIVVQLIMAGVLLGVSNSSSTDTQNIMISVISMIGIVCYIVFSIYSLLISLVTLSLTARRLHDIGWSGWWQLLIYILPMLASIIFLISMVNAEQGNIENMQGIILMMIAAFLVTFLFMLVLFFKDGQKHPNKYGDSPKYPT